MLGMRVGEECEGVSRMRCVRVCVRAHHTRACVFTCVFFHNTNLDPLSLLMSSWLTLDIRKERGMVL